MTVIAVKAGIMAADSMELSGDIRCSAGSPKITRGPGGLIGCCGLSVDCYTVSLWWVGGCDPAETERLLSRLSKGNAGFGGLVLRPDGTVWGIDEKLVQYPRSDIRAIGSDDSASFCMGAMHAGLNAEEAVRLTIENAIKVGGDVQVERIEG
jgi:hypothetical protein